MANQLGMALQHSIVVLADRGWSHRRIARSLGIHRAIVVTIAHVKTWLPWSTQDNHGQTKRVIGLEPTTFTLAT